ncbi:MAG TPA: GDSL-type esterase/lipase family protein [Rhodocyclaceae bacterium]|nr:GDSL-type esterase/lipase family protein [Rhodocyclaceae bacterium]
MDRESWVWGLPGRLKPPTAAEEAVASLPSGGVRKVLLALALAAGMLLAIELALQVRSQVVSGDSIFTVLLAEPRYVVDPETGLQLLNPNRVFTTNGVTVRTNSLGLRSGEVLPVRSPGSWRLAVVGASTVMGAYDADNDQTFPARLEQRLRHDFPDRQVEVINAGIVGFGLEEEQAMLERRIAPLKPDLTIVYTGFNDFLEYCREAHGKGADGHGLPLLSLPSWLMSVDMLKKNTVFLRTSAVRHGGTRDPEGVSLEPYRAKLEAMIKGAEARGMRLVFTTNAKSYRRDQPLDEQMRLSETDRYYTHCFDLNGLHVLYDRHNALIREVATTHGIPVIALDEMVPGGDRYFADSHHFSAEGEALVANALAAFILRRQLLPD